MPSERIDIKTAIGLRDLEVGADLNLSTKYALSKKETPGWLLLAGDDSPGEVFIKKGLATASFLAEVDIVG